MKRLKVNRKGTHKMAENQKGSKHSTKPITEEEKKCLYIHSETILTPLLIAVPHSDEEQDGSAGRGSGTAPGRARDRPETGMRTEAGREGWNRGRGRNGGWNWDWELAAYKKRSLRSFCSLRRLHRRRRRPTLPHCGAVPSARPGLTSLFGMGRGGTPGLKPPEYASCLSGH